MNKRNNPRKMSRDAGTGPPPGSGRSESVTVVLSKENFEEVTCREGTVLVDCWASWCAGCETFATVYEKVASNHPNIVFGKLDTQAERALVSSLGIEHIPSLLVYRDGILLFQQPGSFDEEVLEDIVSQARSIDMNEVRAHLASEERGPED